MTEEIIDKQEQIDQLTAQYIEENGGNNVLYAEYLRMTADLAAESDSTFLGHLDPEIRFTPNDKAYIEALKYVMAYLKSNKMKETLTTLKIEYPDIPTKTGYARRTEVDRTWENLLETSQKLGHRKFEKTVKLFSDEIGLDDPQPKKPKKSSEKQPTEKKSHHSHRH